MPERLFPTLERTDLIVHTYDDGLPRALMETDATPGPGTSIELDTGATVTFQGSFVRRGEPGPDAHLFEVESDGTEDGDVIVTWLTEALEDDLFAKVETRHGIVDLDTDDLGSAFTEPQAAD